MHAPALMEGCIRRIGSERENMEKHCPTCKRRYLEEEINYCLDDGSVLLAVGEVSPEEAPPTVKITDVPTQVMPRSQLNIRTEVMPGRPPAAPATVPVYGDATSSTKSLSFNPWLIAFLGFSIFAFIVALLLMLAWRNPAPDTRPLASGQSLEGTAWAGNNGEEEITIEFLSNG